MNRTALFFDPNHENHDQDGHPESASRLAFVPNLLAEPPDSLALHVVEAEPAPWTAIERVHTPAYTERLRRLPPGEPVLLDSETYLCPGSLDIARRSVGGAFACVDAVYSGEADNGMSLGRPPGHHATPDRAMGFCVFNTVALAARYAQDRYGAGRVAVVDFDVHHGNGTQDAFYSDGSVLFLSIHQSPLYPGTGSLAERGRGDGAGTTLNVPLPGHCGDDIYRVVFDQLFEPHLTRFEPDLLLVSAGYDAHWRDPLANMRLTVEGYASLIDRVVHWADTLCGGRLVLTLEGGYDRPALAASVRATLTRLADPGAAVDDPLGPPPGKGRTVEETVPPILAQIR